MTELKDQLLRKIVDGSVHVGVVGMGYVGLPLALTFVERAKVRVTGFDVDQKKIDALQRGESYIMHLGADRVRVATRAGLFAASSDFEKLREPDALMIAVPTPLTAQREPDMKYVVGTGEDTVRHSMAGT